MYFLFRALCFTTNSFERVNCILFSGEVRTIRYIFITNICLEAYLYKFMSCRKEEVVYVDFREYDSDKYKTLYDVAKKIVILLNFETLYPDIFYKSKEDGFYIDECFKDCIDKNHNLYAFLKKFTNSQIIWFGYDQCFLYKYRQLFGNTVLFNNIIERVNIQLSSYKLTFIDINYLISEVGIKNSYNIRWNYLFNMPYSSDILKRICDELHKQSMIYTHCTPKCLVLDCDNVLWGGIISEDGRANIKLSDFGIGRLYKDFQRYLLGLYYSGVIIAICSKNDYDEVIEVFSHNSEMILRKKHISCFKVNWDTKVENIKDISKSLNIELRDMVFIDDSTFEIEAVHTLLPDVKVILFDKKTIYSEMSCFNLNKETPITQSLLRQETYQYNIKRAELLSKSTDYSEYLKSLKTEIIFSKSNIDEANRIAELSQRTNKLTNGIRLCVDEVLRLFNNGEYNLFSIYAKDRFSDLGLVGVIIIKNRICLELICISCRVLGRNIEHYVMKHIKTKFNIKECTFLDGLKNLEFKSFLKSENIEIKNKNEV